MRAAAALIRGKRLKSCLWSFLRLSYPNTMLPILRTISVGGVLLAITILGLALIPPGRTHMQLSAADAPARGALIRQHEHPEWRQFLLLAAVRRAEELDRLRSLPDASDWPEIPDVALDTAPAEPPSVLPPLESKVAGLPVTDDETASEDVTGSANIAPSATMPAATGTRTRRLVCCAIT